MNSKTETRTKKKKSPIVLWVVLGLILLIIAAAGIYIIRILHELKPESEEGIAIRKDYHINWSGRMNILMIGCDKRTGLNLGVRADTLIVVNLDLKNKIVRTMSIPRDTWVEIPGHNCFDKINATLNPGYFSDGGVGLTLKTVENLLKIPVKLYVKVDFNAFRRVVDALGGIVYDVDKDMLYTDPSDPETVINLKAGVQLLDGEKALQYCRFRWDAQGDFVVDYYGNQCGRTSRQLRFMQELAKKAIETDNLLTMNSVINIIIKDTDTNVDSSELLKIALLFRNIDPSSQLRTIVFPGSVDWVSERSVILPKEGFITTIEREFLDAPIELPETELDLDE